MKVLVVYAHPNPESFNSAVHQIACKELRSAGHQVHDLDLYEENFEARMSRAERESYMTKDNTKGLENHVAKLRWADSLVFIYPTWWMGPPAILKGWLDRVWLPGIVVTFGPDGVKPGLTNIKKIMVITTQGSSWWRMNIVGNPPRFMFKQTMKACTQFKDFNWLALYSMDKVTEKAKADFLLKVKNRMTSF